MSGLSNFFKNQNNINLSLSDKGINISGGEKQRIGIARSLYNEPELLILDEATSSLDIKTEKIFLSHIEKLKGKLPQYLFHIEFPHLINVILYI